MRPCVRGSRSLCLYPLRARGMCSCVRGFQRLGCIFTGFIRTARAGNAPFRAWIPKFRFYTRCVRGEFAPACAVPEVHVLYALRARGMRSCVRGFQRLGFIRTGFIRTACAGHAFLRARMLTLKFHKYFALGACVHACADSRRLGSIYTARRMHPCVRELNIHGPARRANSPPTDSRNAMFVSQFLFLFAYVR